MKKTDWMQKAGYGMFCHYLGKTGMTSAEWNRQVDGFNTEGFAEHAAQTGAGYVVFTLGQNSGHFCAPNDTYDMLVGHLPSLCSQRNLIGDLSDALRRRGLRLLVYIPSGAPDEDACAVKSLEWDKGVWGGGSETQRERLRYAAFQRKWESVLRDWSLRFCDGVSGWWVDGCYFAEDMYNFESEPNWNSFKAALCAGNDESVIAFNPGVRVPVRRHAPCEDYTAGEISDAFPVCPGPEEQGALWHVLSYLGTWWGAGTPRFSDDFVRGYSWDTIRAGGVETWDMPVSAEGVVPDGFLRQLEQVGKTAARRV